ncbi:MAG TPA: rhombotarget lipoprotein, partial [Burkholderiales bacterium]|nr:rhombotarget lipoprotein [Burkholderiales bacterium]
MRKVVSIVFLCFVLGGCATPTKHTSTSVVDFLYPDVRDPVVSPGTPVLALPLRVGIAFVPGQRGAATSFALTEKRQSDVLNEVANHFKKSPFVRTIEVIPSAYLRPRGGFANLDQIRTM